MREQLNNNPLVQMGAIAVLLLIGAIFLLTSMGGGEESESESGGSSIWRPPLPVRAWHPRPAKRLRLKPLPPRPRRRWPPSPCRSR